MTVTPSKRSMDFDPTGPTATKRIRKLLIRAAHEHLITEDGANQIHAEMVSYGFWDSTCPF